MELSDISSTLVNNTGIIEILYFKLNMLYVKFKSFKQNHRNVSLNLFTCFSIQNFNIVPHIPQGITQGVLSNSFFNINIK